MPELYHIAATIYCPSPHPGPQQQGVHHLLEDRCAAGHCRAHGDVLVLGGWDHYNQDFPYRGGEDSGNSKDSC
jgi:hypothetical protein